MPRGRKKKHKAEAPSVKPELLKSLVAIALIVVSGLIAISFFMSDYSFNAKIQELLMNSFGVGSVFMVLITSLIGLMFIDSLNFRYKKFSVLVGLIIAMVVTSTFAHLSFFLSSAEVALEKADAGSGGGFVGYMVGQLLINTISIYGAVLILLALSVLAVILAFDVTLQQIFELIQKILARFGGVTLPKLPAKEEKGAEDSFDVSTGYAEPDSLPEEIPMPAQISFA